MARVSTEYLKLVDYIKRKPDGFSLDYDLVQRETGISMTNQRNRNKLGKAIIRSKRRYLIFPGLGYQLDDPKNTMQIVDNAGIKLTRQLRRSSETTTIVTRKHISKLDVEDQGKLKAINSVYNILERKTTKFEEIEIKTVRITEPPLNLADRK